MTTRTESWLSLIVTVALVTKTQVHLFLYMKVNASSSSLPTKRKRLSQYRSEWQMDHEWVGLVSAGNEYKANCGLCHRVYFVAHGRLSDLKQHYYHF